MEQRDLVKIATAIREKRASMGLTQEQAAEYVGISHSFYVKIENAIQPPSLDTLVKICDAYHISMDRLLLKWSVPGQITPLQAELLFDLQQMEPHQLQGCRDIMDKLIAIADGSSNA